MELFEELTISLEESYASLAEEECRYDRVTPELTGLANAISMEAGVNRAQVIEFNAVAKVHDIELNEKQFSIYTSPNGLSIALEGIAETTYENVKKFIKMISEWFGKVYKAITSHAKRWFKSRDVEKREKRANEVLDEVQERVEAKEKEGESPITQPLELTLLTKRLLDMTNRNSKDSMTQAIDACFVDFHVGDSAIDFTMEIGLLEAAAKEDGDKLATRLYEFYTKLLSLLAMAGFDDIQLPPIDPRGRILTKYNDWAESCIDTLRKEAKDKSFSVASTEVTELTNDLRIALAELQMGNVEKRHQKTITGLEDAIGMQVWEDFADTSKGVPPEVIAAFSAVELELRRRREMAVTLVKLVTLRDLFVFGAFDQITGAIKDLNVKTK